MPQCVDEPQSLSCRAGVATPARQSVFPESRMYARFKDIVRLADILGHSSVDTTRIYTARSGKEERRQLGQLRLIL